MIMSDRRALAIRSDVDYFESTLRVHAFIPRVISRPFGMSLPRTSWVRLNHLQTGVGRFHSSIYKWGLAPSPNCECGATEKTADQVISSCLIHHVPRGTQGLQILDDIGLVHRHNIGKQSRQSTKLKVQVKLVPKNSA